MVVYRYRLSVYVDTVYSMYGYYTNTMFVYEKYKNVFKKSTRLDYARGGLSYVTTFKLCCLKIDEDSQNSSLLLSFLYYYSMYIF